MSNDSNIDRRKRQLSARQQAYANNRGKGLPRQQSAVMAGYPDHENQGIKVEESQTVKEELARIREEASTNTGVKKEQVIEMLVEAGNMARLMADPQGLVAAARELGKMLGFYAPEVKKTLLGVDQATLKQALKDMSDDELYKLSHARTIDGESKRIPEQLPEKV